MTTMNRMGEFTASCFPVRLFFLTLPFLFVSCTGDGATDEVPVATPAPSVVATTERPSPAATEVEVNAGALVADRVRERNRFGESVGVEVEEETSVVDLPGLTLYRATPLIPDLLDEHCAVYQETVWCFQEALQNIVSRFRLGSDPGQLSDQEWLALVAFFTGRAPLADSDDLDTLDKYIPDAERAKISAPSVAPLESGGVQIAFFYEDFDVAAYPGGPLALWKREIVITDDNALSVDDTEVWRSPEDLWLTPVPDD